MVGDSVEEGSLLVLCKALGVLRSIDPELTIQQASCFISIGKLRELYT